MSFWDVFIACLTGAGAMLLALSVVSLVLAVVIFAGGFLIEWAADAFENRRRR